MAQHALEGQVTLTYPSSGLVWELEAKACRVVAMGESRPYDLGFNGV